MFITAIGQSKIGPIYDGVDFLSFRLSPDLSPFSSLLVACNGSGCATVGLPMLIRYCIPAHLLSILCHKSNVESHLRTFLNEVGIQCHSTLSRTNMNPAMHADESEWGPRESFRRHCQLSASSPHQSPNQNPNS
jgi:hypothetical protein